MNSQLPEKYGGAGASYVDGVLIGEELAWGCAAIGTTLGTNELAAAPVLLGGSEKIKAEYLEAARLLAWQSAVLLDQGEAQHPAVLTRQALRCRHGHEGRYRRRADLRGLRLHQGLPGREADAATPRSCSSTKGPPRSSGS
jgi:alkylation response protein AidB-like acyl-CoA dehydrogenase